MTHKPTAMTILGILVLGAGALAATAALSADVTSLRGETAIDDINATPKRFGVDESGPITRAFRQQPPLIPHRIDKYEIDLKVNQCLRCHDWPYNVEENAPKISETHYEDRQGERLDFVAGTRWFCTQCHVPQATAQPLVENEFEPVRLNR
ncbi:MAG: nitrate reductase cytochrome c-type subunit [Rhodospirillales bacterium]|nr:nitrate reductase cytochrome c-type subunit [Rhodospirillales bacterium]